MAKKKTVSCMFCGKPIVTYSDNAKSYKCDVCRAEYNKIRNKVNQRVMRGTVKRSDVQELVDKEMFAFGRKRIEDDKVMDDEIAFEPLPNQVHCKFCGKMTIHPTEFCSTCRADGLDVVYNTTGRSDGWERRRTKTVKVKGGWRGRRVMGGCAANKRVET